MKRLVVLERHDWDRWQRESDLGHVNGRWPYGVERLLKHGWQVRHPQLLWQEHLAGRALRRLESPLRRHVDVELLHPLSGLPEIVRADAAVCIFEDMAWLWGIPKLQRHLPPLLVMTCWLGQRLLAPGKQPALRWKRITDAAAAITVFSENQIPLLQQRLHVTEDKILPLKYGVDTAYFTPAQGQPEDDYVAAIGGDVGRDWPTLLAAAALTPKVRYRLLTWPDRVRGMRVPGNVDVGTAVGDSYRKVLREAAFVVVPTHPLAYPTGQSVVLEAMSCGTPVIATETPALRGYLDDRCTVTVRPGDAAALASAIVELYGDPARRARMRVAAREIALTHYCSNHMWDVVAERLATLA